MVHCGTQRVAMFVVGSPSASLSWFIMCDYFASWRRKISFVVVHDTMKVSSDGELRMQSRGPQENQFASRLW
jgi:hypothetical protein